MKLYQIDSIEVTRMMRKNEYFFLLGSYFVSAEQLIKCVLPEKKRKITIHQLNIQIEWQLKREPREFLIIYWMPKIIKPRPATKNTLRFMENKNDSEKCINDPLIRRPNELFAIYEVKCSNDFVIMCYTYLGPLGFIIDKLWIVHEHVMNRAQILSLR